MLLSKGLLRDLHHEFIGFKMSYGAKRPSYAYNQAFFIKGIPGSGKTMTAITYCANHDTTLYFSFRGLDASFAPRVFSAGYPNVFNGCETWNDFFGQLFAFYENKSGIVFFDDAGARNDKEEFLSQLQKMLEKSTHYRIFVVFLLKPWEQLAVSAKVLRVDPLSPAAIRRTFALNDADTFRLYAVTDGNPYLLSLYDTNKTFAENMADWLRRDSPFCRYPQDWIASCFRAPESYNTLMYGMAKGLNRVSELSNLSGFPQNKVDKYLKALEEHGLVIREKEPGSRPRYLLASNCLQLWFRFLFAARTDAQGCFTEETISACLQYLDSTLVPQTFRKSVLYWLDHRQSKYVGQHIDVSVPYKQDITVQGVHFDYVYQTRERESRYIVVKLFDRLETRCGLKDWQAIEEAALSVSPFYRSTLILASINRFSDAVWERTSEMSNVKLVQVQTLTETGFNPSWPGHKNDGRALDFCSPL